MVHTVPTPTLHRKTGVWDFKESKKMLGRTEVSTPKILRACGAISPRTCPAEQLRKVYVYSQDLPEAIPVL